MSEQVQVFVDYTILSPFGKLSNKAGPFTSDKDAAGFIEELKGHHRSMLLEAKLRRLTVQEG